MTGINWKGWRLRKKSLAMWWLVRILIVLTLVSLPLVNITITNAKYTAGASAAGSGRVAKWVVRVTATGLPAPTKTIPAIPNAANGTAGGTAAGHPLVLFFEGRDASSPNTQSTLQKKDAKFPVQLINDSEVSARFTPVWTTTSGTADFYFYDGTTDVSGGVDLAPGTSKVVDAVIKTSTFTGLKFGAHVEQLD